MFLALVMAAMTMVVSDSSVFQNPAEDITSVQNLTVTPEEMEFLEQLELLEAWEMLKAPAIDKEMELLLPENLEDQKN